MLILGRQPGEVILIGDDIRVTILDIRGSKAHVGIDAPKAIKINRQEVVERTATESLPPAGGGPKTPPAT